MMETKNNQSSSSSVTAPGVGCLLGRLVDEKTGKAKDPNSCIIQYGGRVRLPDKLVEILNKDFAPEVIWWQPDGECFAFDSSKVQEKILDVWFRGTKLTSFIRSLNRWGFRRVFYHALPESALAFHHSSFGKASTPDMLKQMKMSKSGKASQAMAVSKNNVPAASAPVALATNSITGACLGTDRLTQLSELAGLANLSPNLPLSNTAVPAELPMTTTNGGSTATADHDLLLRLLSEQRNRQLLADAQAGRRASLVASSFSAAPATVPADQQVSSFSAMQQLLMAQRGPQQQAQAPHHRQDESSCNSTDQRQRMIQELLVANQRQQDLVNLHRQQQQHDAVRIAILALNNNVQQQQNQSAR